MSSNEKLTTEIEKTIHGHVQTIKESSIDFVVLYIRRNNINVDRDSLAKILEVFRIAIDNEHLNNVDKFLQNLDKTLTEFSKE
jgi:hypothetical protein